MPDKKISQLTAATTPLAGTEVLPIVQSAATVKVATDDLTVKNVRSNATSGILQIAGPGAGTTRTMTVPNANFTAARTDAAQSFTGNQTLSTGNLVVGTAGNGVDFSVNSHAAGMTSELLTWYEEGTWTPTYASSNGDMTIGSYDVRDGRYVRIGRQVIINFSVATATVTAVGTGFVIITGLPFTLPSSSLNCAGSIGYSSNGYMTACYVATNTAEIRVSGHSSTSAQSTIDRTSAANFQGTGSFNNYLIGIITYSM